MHKILFLCTGNSVRSQMAEGFARNILPKNCKIYSAGMTPSCIHPSAIKVMEEVGIDITHQQSKKVSEIPANDIDYVITLCGDARNQCPVFPRMVAKEHWPIDAPLAVQGEDGMNNFRSIRDEIKTRVEELAKRLSM
ncbi:MAG: arsenate reductase ArsC [Deltaproteobacteria bacterium CG07_land_8_20_14_0_80_38_7]|nr:MAG: arsenate reductase ArsC [Deltaproteobacteria bacterium CG07_land_8_20_14_0_80_38_7]